MRTNYGCTMWTVQDTEIAERASQTLGKLQNKTGADVLQALEDIRHQVANKRPDEHDHAEIAAPIVGQNSIGMCACHIPRHPFSQFQTGPLCCNATSQDSSFTLKFVGLRL